MQAWLNKENEGEHVLKWEERMRIRCMYVCAYMSKRDSYDMKI